jgi:hypothetical protein
MITLGRRAIVQLMPNISSHILRRWSEKRHDKVSFDTEKDLNFKGVWGK